MTTRIIRANDLPAPTPARLKSTLLDHYPPVQPGGDFGLRSTEGLWHSYNTGVHVVTPDWCDPEAPSFEEPLWADGLSFALQTGWRCSAIGLDRARMEAEAKRVFEATESRGIETFLGDTLTAGTDVVVGDLGLAPSAWEAVALLEGSAAATYAGLPTIHLSRFEAALISEYLTWVGDKAYTLLGSRVVIGGGYDVTQPDGSMTAFATGDVVIERSDEIMLTVNEVPSDGFSAIADEAARPEGDGSTVLVTASRLYRVGLDPLATDAVALTSATEAWDLTP